MSHRKLPLSLMMISCASLALNGCALNLGPQTKTQVVIVKPGDPLTVTKNVIVEGQTLKTEAMTKQDIGGWITMPREHFDAMKRALEKLPTADEKRVIEPVR